MKLKYLIISLLFLVFSCTSPVKEEVLTINGNTMGTTFSVKFTSPSPVDIIEIEKDINSLLIELNRQMSTYIPNSELSRFNKSTDTTWVSVSEDLAYVVNSAQKISEISEGLFDITIGPAVNIWGFGPDNKPQFVPNKEAIEKALKLVGYKNIQVKLNPPEIKKSNPNVYCDLSAIAKGFGVDIVSEYLTQKGLTNYLVEIGGELRASGAKFKDKWKVGISVPSQDNTIQETITLSNQSMATSGDYWNYFEEDGIRYSHTINPITGKPITHKLASVTVVAKTCMEADALATAIDVMGPELGLKFATKNELNVYFIVKGKNGFESFSTESFIDLKSKGN